MFASICDDLNDEVPVAAEEKTQPVILPLTIDDIQNGNIYLEARETLSNRIDFAWSVYRNVSSSQTIKNQAYDFLLKAFNIFHVKDHVKDAHSVLEYLMKKKNKYRSTNPEYLPHALSYPQLFNPGYIVPTQTQFHGVSPVVEIEKAIQQSELLDVSDKTKQCEIAEKTIFFDKQARSKYRVHINDGRFMKDGKLFDTSGMSSHGMKDYAAFTLNTNGELSVFNHLFGEDNIVHSSINAGAPVICAGELKIKKGLLEAVNTHSGHYCPTVFNIYRLLQFFSNNDISLSLVMIYTYDKLSENIPGLTSTLCQFDCEGYNLKYYQTPAHQIYTSLQTGMHHHLNNIIDDVMYDMRIHEEDTPEEIKMIKQLRDDTLLLKKQMDSLSRDAKTKSISMTSSLFKYSISKIKDLFAIYQEKIEDMAEQPKQQYSHLAARLGLYKKQLKTDKYINLDQTEENSDLVVSIMKKSH